MNPSGISLFNQARIEWAIRLKYSPMPSLDMDILAGQLNAFRIGDFRQIGKTWEVMMERDGELAVNSDKRKSDAAGLEWQIVSDGSPDGDRHAAALQYFYENLTATEALEQDATGGTDELIYQIGSALDYRYSIHEMLLRVDNAAAREVTAEFRHTPLWFFEARRGYLGYMPHIFDLYGIPCVQGEWLTAVNIGWMRPLSMAYAMKMFPLRDWLLFCTRYGSGFLDATTDATVDTAEWQQAQDALNTLANDGAVLHNAGVSFKFLEQAARNSLPFQPIVEMINGLYSKCYRGVDLATGSRGASSGGEGGSGASPVGASVQREESGILLVRDAKWLTGTFNERVDRPVIRYLFHQEPRAWFVLMPPLDDTSAQDLAALQGLVPMGFRVMLKEVYQRFRWSVPEAGEACLAPAAPAAPNEEGGMKNEETAGKSVSGKQTPDAKSQPPENPEPRPQIHKQSAPARVAENTPIAAGADPRRNPGLAAPGNPGYAQAASRQMPLVAVRPAPQVNDSGPGSVTGLRGEASARQAGLRADASARQAGLQSPALGYSIPNDAAQLETLGKVGLGNSRAAQALRRAIVNRQSPIANAVALANSGEPQPFAALENDAAGIDDDGWALIAPFGNHPKTRVFREGDRVKEQKFIQVLDEESADAMLSNENSFFRKLKRALVGIPVYKGHGDLNDHDPKALASETQKIKLGVVDKIRKAARGIEAHFALDSEGAEAVAEGWKLPSAFWLVMPIGNEVLADGQQAILARPFKLLSVALTQFPNISGVESLANSGAGVSPARTQPETHGQDARATTISGVESLANARSAALPSRGSTPAASTPERQQTQTQDTIMKQLLIGWLAAQGIALANEATDQAVFEAFNREMLNRSTSISALGNEKNTLNTAITTLTTDLGVQKKRADDAGVALGNEQTARRAERKGRAEMTADLAIQRGRKTVAERGAVIAALENSADFEKDARALLEGRPVIKTEAVSGKLQAALNNEQQQTQAEYQDAFRIELMATGQNPVAAHNNIMRLPKYAGLAAKLVPAKAA